MKMRRVRRGDAFAVQIAVPGGWVDVARALNASASSVQETDARAWCHDAVALLSAPNEVRHGLLQAAATLPPEQEDGAPSALPFAARSFRDFMLYEQHAIAAARGFVRSFMPRLSPIVRAYEGVIGAPFPPLKPSRIWYRQPIYYMGNHLAFVTDGDIVAPSYSRALDYELELGFVLVRELYDADPAEAEAAIGGFVVINDFSARDVQHEEMRSGFGPQKAKHFCNGMSSILVSADEILPRWRDLTGYVRVNGNLIAAPSSAGAHFSLGEALAHVSRSERLYPGELFATGTLPGGSGIEREQFVSVGDAIEVGITGVGTLTNRIVRKDGRAA